MSRTATKRIRKSHDLQHSKVNNFHILEYSEYSSRDSFEDPGVFRVFQTASRVDHAVLSRVSSIFPLTNSEFERIP